MSPDEPQPGTSPVPWQTEARQGPVEGPDGTLWRSPEALAAELYRRPYREAEIAGIEAREIAEHGGEPRECGYCGLETRTVAEWIGGAECTRCHGTWDRQP